MSAEKFAVVRKYFSAIVLSVVVLAILLAEKYPQIFFVHHRDYRNLTLYSSDDIPVSIDRALEQALQLLARSPVYDGRKNYRVFVANNRLLYAVIGPDFSQGSFAKTNLFNTVVIRRCDLSSANCFSNSPMFNVRSLSGLIAHEVTHVNMRAYLGHWKEAQLPRWIREGFPDYIAASGSYTAPDAFEQYLHSVVIDSKSYEYYRYRMAVAYALDERKLSLQQLIDARTSVDALAREQCRLTPSCQSGQAKP